MPCRAANAAYVRQRRAGSVYPNPAELVDAVLAEMHLSKLKAQGVGYRQAANLAGLSPQLVADVRSGRKTRIRADTNARILNIPAVLAHGQVVTGWRTWRLLDSLKREGFTQTRIARHLGASAPQLQIQRRHIRVRTALRVRVLYRRINDVDADDHAK